MKTNISKAIVGLCLASTVFSTTGCIEETFPTNAATQEQLASSAKATEALLWAMPAFFNKFDCLGGERHDDWGYGSIMHMRDVMTDDYAVVAHSYNWYSNQSQNLYMGEDYIYSQLTWNFFYKFIQTANNMVSAINPEEASEMQLGYLGAGHAFRALAYLDASRMYEFLPNDKTSSINAAGNNVEGLTMPIVKEGMTEAEARENPRVDRATMAAFIEDDLNKAEEYIVHLENATKTLPHLDAVYGLKARLYMWLEDYAKAKEYARKAINASSVGVMTEDECLSTTKGFNDISQWMWGSQMVSEDDVVQSGIINWTSWTSNEAAYGYAGAGPYVMIGASFYDRISDTDFRKKMWKAPAGTALDGKTPFINAGIGANIPEYGSVKFRPAEGNTDDFAVGSASAFPVMRVEEMYFIEAEAAAHLSEAEGKQLVTDFMVNYRDPKYVCNASGEALIDEIVFQKRIELWGEGLNLYDVKRLNMSVTRGYVGTNFDAAELFNTNGRPAWVNFCFVRNEKNNNSALLGYENPDPSGLYTPWSE